MFKVVEVEIQKIQVGEHEQRLDKDDEEINGLAASIGRVGVLVPLILEKSGDTFQLVSGHRRLLASKRVGLSVVPCIVKDSAEADADEVTFAENFFRRDLSPVELACALKGSLAKESMTVEELAAGFNRSVHWVNSMLAIADCPADVLEAIHNEKISVSAASNLACVTEPVYRQFLVRNAVESGATARATAAWLQAWRSMQPPEEAVQAEPLPPGNVPVSLVPQAPCLCCAQLFEVNMMSHVPVCGACIQILRTVGMEQSASQQIQQRPQGPDQVH